MTLQPMLEQLPSFATVIQYVDDHCMLCSTAAEAAETKHAFEEALGALPGTFSPKHLFVCDVSQEGFDFLGYRFELEKGHLQVSIPHALFECFLERCEGMAAGGAAVEEIGEYVEAWWRSNEVAHGDEYYWHVLPEVPVDAVRMVKQTKGKWKLPLSGITIGR
jgi:hypothetical protein